MRISRNRQVFCNFQHLFEYFSRLKTNTNSYYFFQAKTAAGLKELRNKSIFFFSVFNALFVLIVFMLTLHKDTLHVDWPWGVKENTTYTDDDQVRFRGEKKGNNELERRKYTEI